MIEPDIDEIPPRRKRRMIKRFLLRGTAIVTTTSLVLWLILFIRFHHGEVVIRHDYIAMLNATAVNSPRDQRAWPHLREAIIELETTLPYDFSLDPGYVADPEDEQWQELASRLEQSSDALDRIRHAASMRFLGYVVTHTISEDDRPIWPEYFEYSSEQETEPGLLGAEMVGMQYSSGIELRRLANVLAIDGRRVAQDGDGATVVQNFKSIAGLAQFMNQVPTMMNQLTGVSMYFHGFELLRDRVYVNPESFDDEQLIELSGLVSAISDDAFRISFDSERWTMLDVFQRCYTDNGNGGGHFVGPQFEHLPGAGHRYTKWSGSTMAYIWSFVSPGRKEVERLINGMFDDADNLVRIPLWERQDVKDEDASLDFMEQHWRWKFSYARMMIEILTPAFAGSAKNAERLIQDRDVTLAVIALEQYRRAHGSWPAALDALVPEYLPELPIDRFIGKPLGYKVDEQGEPMLYSVGANMEDNGGVADLDRYGWPTNQLTQRWRTRSEIEALRLNPDRASPIPEADYILWPPPPPAPPEEDLDEP